MLKTCFVFDSRRMFAVLKTNKRYTIYQMLKFSQKFAGIKYKYLICTIIKRVI
jgi:hypothetical protein